MIDVDGKSKFTNDDVLFVTLLNSVYRDMKNPLLYASTLFSEVKIPKQLNHS